MYCHLDYFHSAEDKLGEIRQKLKDFDNRIGSRTKAIKVNCHCLGFKYTIHTLTSFSQSELISVEDAKENIATQREEVVSNIKQINNATLEYEFNNFITSFICDTTRNYSYSVFKRWLLFYPLLQLYMANESKVNANVYASAVVEGDDNDNSFESNDKLTSCPFFRLFDSIIIALGD